MIVVQILELLESDGSRLAKEQILEDNCRNMLLQDVLVAALDPYTNYGVAKFKMPKVEQCFRSDESISDKMIQAFLGLLNQLAVRDLTGNAARSAVEGCFGNMNELEQKWCKRILLKNLRAGAQGSTINKVWPGLIKEFCVSLAHTLSATSDSGQLDQMTIDEKINYPVYVDAKLDGFRCIAIKRFGEVSFYSRNGKPVDTLPTLKKAIENCPVDNFVLDGETIASDGKWESSATVIGSRKNSKDDSGIMLAVFDTMSFDEWANQESTFPLSKRLEQVAEIVSRINHKNVVQVKGEYVNNQEELISFYRDSLDKGHEGLMVKEPKATYQFKRSNAVRKLKPFTTHEGVIVGWYEGRDGTKRAGEFGGFNVVLPSGVVTKVGSGWSDSERAQFMIANPKTFFGQIMEIQGQFLTPDLKVRFPVFIRWRDASDVDPLVVEAGQKILNF